MLNWFKRSPVLKEKKVPKLVAISAIDVGPLVVGLQESGISGSDLDYTIKVRNLGDKSLVKIESDGEVVQSFYTK